MPQLFKAKTKFSNAARPSAVYSIDVTLPHEPGVFKLFYDKHFVIIKAKDMGASISSIQKQLNQYMRKAEGQQSEGNIYKHFYEFIKKHPGKEFSKEIVLKSDSAYELLKAEQTALDADKANKLMLNNTTEAYIPQYNELTQKYGWISKGDVLNYNKWLKSRNKRAPRKKKA
jgi:hypothetical protein